MRAERGALSHPTWKRRKLEIADAPSVSLRNALSSYKISRTSRLSLSIIIANSIRQFYTSKWMPRPWTKDDLYFLREADDCEDDMQIYAHRPHLATVFEPADPTDGMTGKQHRHPKILALGIILLEVELGINLEDEWKPKDLKANAEPTSNTDYVTALDILADESRWLRRETIPIVKKVIQWCLEDELGECTTALDECDAIHRRVVGPLEDIWNIVATEKLSELDVARLNPMKPKSVPSLQHKFVKRANRACARESIPLQPLRTSVLTAWVGHVFPVITFRIINQQQQT
jgi:hypothetical protein